MTKIAVSFSNIPKVSASLMFSYYLLKFNYIFSFELFPFQISRTKFDLTCRRNQMKLLKNLLQISSTSIVKHEWWIALLCAMKNEIISWAWPCPGVIIAHFCITHIIIVIVRWYLSLFRIDMNESFHAKLIRSNLICGALSFYGATCLIDQNR